MEFKEYMRSIPNQRDELRAKLAELCCVADVTVYKWMRGEYAPDTLKRKIIAEYLNVPEEDLWPNV